MTLRSKLEGVRLIRAVEQLRTIDKELEMLYSLVFSLPGGFIDAVHDVSAAHNRIKHALFVLDDSGESEQIMQKRFGV